MMRVHQLPVPWKLILGDSSRLNLTFGWKIEGTECEREGAKQRRPIHRYRVGRLEIVGPAIASEECSVASRQSNSVFKTPSRT
jgi:hypothetical protein